MLIVTPRSTSSGARSIRSKAVNRVVDPSRSASTLVIAAVRVVLPWSTWPMVPMFRCGLERTNCCLVIGVLEVTGRVGAARLRLAGTARAEPPIPAPRTGQTRRASGARTLLRRLWQREEGQRRAPASRADTAATAPGRSTPAGLRVATITHMPQRCQAGSDLSPDLPVAASGWSAEAAEELAQVADDPAGAVSQYSITWVRKRSRSTLPRFSPPNPMNSSLFQASWPAGESVSP